MKLHPLRWWNRSTASLDGLLRAAMAHFWFVTIHPFADGNGRIARAITDMALAQNEKTGKRLYSLSSYINSNKTKYYDILEKTQKGDGDLTEWYIWFLDAYTSSIEHSKKMIAKSLAVSRFYQHIANIPLNERELKVIGKLLECYPDDYRGGLTNKKYVSMTKISPETAKRDLKDLVAKQLLIQGAAGGRSTSYQLNRELFGRTEKP